jgi:hypothetical protein
MSSMQSVLIICSEGRLEKLASDSQRQPVGPVEDQV